MRTLITGGAGFIGSHVATALLDRGVEVRVIDNLSPQVHEASERPAYLSRDVELMIGDIRDSDLLDRALAGVDAVLHLAAAVGVGQSMYEIVNYTSVNDLGTASLLEAVLRHPIERLVCASSMSVYGEGAARRLDGVVVDPLPRTEEQLRAGRWDPVDETGSPLTPVPTAETKPPSLRSVYALNKFSQEQLCLVAGRAYGISTCALRFFNVYGPHQALSNPYTGVLAIFAARLLNKRPPVVFEDGRQRRDFVHVRDVAAACVLALTSRAGDGDVFNVGSGESRTVASIATELAVAMGAEDIAPHITGKSRAGDIRHCFADIAKAGTTLGYRPVVDFRDGLLELSDWLRDQIAVDRIEHATAELQRRGLVA